MDAYDRAEFRKHAQRFKLYISIVKDFCTIIACAVVVWFLWTQRNP